MRPGTVPGRPIDSGSTTRCYQSGLPGSIAPDAGPAEQSVDFRDAGEGGDGQIANPEPAQGPGRLRQMVGDGKMSGDGFSRSLGDHQRYTPRGERQTPEAGL